jgi:hypothetical protein
VCRAGHRRRPPIAGCSFSSCSTVSRVRSLCSPLGALDTVSARRASATVGDGRTGGLRTPGGFPTPSSRRARRHPSHSDNDPIRFADDGSANALQDLSKSSVVRRPDVQLRGDCASPLGSGVVGQPTLLRPRERLQHPTDIGAHHAQSPKRLAKSANRRMTSWRLPDFPARLVRRVRTHPAQREPRGRHPPPLARVGGRNVNLTTGGRQLDNTGRLIERGLIVCGNPC